MSHLASVVQNADALASSAHQKYVTASKVFFDTGTFNSTSVATVHGAIDDALAGAQLLDDAKNEFSRISSTTTDQIMALVQRVRDEKTKVDQEEASRRGNGESETYSFLKAAIGFPFKSGGEDRTFNMTTALTQAVGLARPLARGPSPSTVRTPYALHPSRTAIPTPMPLRPAHAIYAPLVHAPIPGPHAPVGIGSYRYCGLGWCPADPGDCVKIVEDAVNLVANQAKALANEIKNLPDEFVHLGSNAIDILGDVVAVIGALPSGDAQKAWEKFKQLVKDVGNFTFEVLADYETIATLDLPYGFVLAKMVGMWPPQPNPREIAKVTFNAAISGDFETAKVQLEGHAQQFQDMVGFVPGIGTGVAEALGVALAIIEGNSSLEIALKAMIDLPPFVYLPPNIKDLLRALIDAVVKLFEGDSVEDLALATTRKAILDQLPSGTPDDIKSVVADFFDAMAQVILHGKALKDVGYQVALKAVKRAMGPAIDSIKATVDQTIQGAQKDVVKNLLDELPPDIVDQMEAIAASLPEPAQSQLRTLKSKVETVVSPFIDLLKNLASFRKFKAVAEREYIDSAAIRAKNSTLPAKSQEELVAIRDAALVSTDWYEIQNAQLTLLSYGATEVTSSPVGLGAGAEAGVQPPVVMPPEPRVVLLARTLDEHMRDIFFANPQLMATGLFFYLAFYGVNAPPLQSSDKAYLQTMMSTLLKVQAQGLYPPDLRTGQCEPGSPCALLADAIAQTKTQIDRVSGPIKPLPGDIVRVSGALGLPVTSVSSSASKGLSVASKTVLAIGVAGAATAGGLWLYGRRHHEPLKQVASNLVQTRRQKTIAIGAALGVILGAFVFAKLTSRRPPVIQRALVLQPVPQAPSTPAAQLAPVTANLASAKKTSTFTKFLIGTAIAGAAGAGGLWWYAHRHGMTMKQASSHLWQSTKQSARNLVPKKRGRARENPVEPLPTSALGYWNGDRRLAPPQRPRELAFRVRLDVEPYYESVVLQGDGTAILYRFMRPIVRFTPGKYQLSKIRSGYGNILIDSNQVIETLVTRC